MKTTTLVACLLCATYLNYSQETLSASGGDATSTDGIQIISVKSILTYSRISGQDNKKT